MTKEKCKNKVAKDFGYKNWNDAISFLRYNSHNDNFMINELENLAMDLYLHTNENLNLHSCPDTKTAIDLLKWYKTKILNLSDSETGWDIIYNKFLIETNK